MNEFWIFEFNIPTTERGPAVLQVSIESTLSGSDAVDIMFPDDPEMGTLVLDVKVESLSVQDDGSPDALVVQFKILPKGSPNPLSPRGLVVRGTLLPAVPDAAAPLTRPAKYDPAAGLWVLVFERLLGKAQGLSQRLLIGVTGRTRDDADGGRIKRASGSKSLPLPL